MDIKRNRVAGHSEIKKEILGRNRVASYFEIKRGAIRRNRVIGHFEIEERMKDINKNISDVSFLYQRRLQTHK